MQHNTEDVGGEKQCSVERKVLMSCPMQECRRTTEQERICLRHLDSAPHQSLHPLQLSPRYSGHEWLSVWIWELSAKEENRVWWGSLCVSTCGDEGYTYQSLALLAVLAPMQSLK